MLRKLLKTSFYLLLFTVTIMASCTGPKQTTSKKNTEQTIVKKHPGFTKGTINRFEIDGCSFLITIEGGKKLNPLNLGEEFKKDGLNIWFKYIYQKEVMTTCMAGDVIKITEIKNAEK